MTGKKEAMLVLADGTVFRGVSVGKEGEAIGEVVFTTSMTGYQETLTDPSYAGQMVTFTYPHIGNVGVNDDDMESSKVHATGAIMRAVSKRASNFRATDTFPNFLEQQNVVGISGVDTRKLTLRLRDYGAQMGIITTDTSASEEVIERARSLAGMEGQNLVSVVTTREPYEWTEGGWELNGEKRHASSSAPLVVALDFGVKYSILRLLVDAGFRVEVVPASTPAETILSKAPAGVFLSNGPGDPATVEDGIACVRALLGQVPMFGICLGHQILGHALGVATFKLPFGHRGGNHPVRNERTGRVSITVQNHGFASKNEGIPDGVSVSYLNLCDNTVEGFDVPDAKAFSVQYHPEASPGPHDARYLFERFYSLVSSGSLQG